MRIHKGGDNMLHELKEAHNILKYGESEFANYSSLFINVIEKFNTLNDDEKAVMHQLIIDAYTIGRKKGAY